MIVWKHVLVDRHALPNRRIRAGLLFAAGLDPVPLDLERHGPIFRAPTPTQEHLDPAAEE